MTLPNFIVIGVYKSGTTSLYHYLKEHPQIYLSTIKEMNFFAYENNTTAKNSWGTSITSNKNAFPIKNFEAYQKCFRTVSTEKAIGDVSPMYMISAGAPQRIYDCLPNVKLIAILRNPIDRAYSAYLMHVRNGELRQGAEEYFKTPLDKREIQTGFYYSQLLPYFKLFSFDQVKLFFFEDIKSRPVELMQDIYRYLDVNDSFIPNMEVIHNIGGNPRHPRIYQIGRWFWNWQKRHFSISSQKVLAFNVDKIMQVLRKYDFDEIPELDNDIRKRLTTLYRDDILKLQELIQTDLTHWLQS